MIKDKDDKPGENEDEATKRKTKPRPVDPAEHDSILGGGGPAEDRKKKKE